MSAAMRAIAFALALLTAPRVFAAEAKTIKVVYHFTGGLDQSVAALRNVRNHLNAQPGVKIVVVANGDGIDFLLDGAKDKNGNPFDVIVQELSARNVEFRACGNTLVARKVDRSKLIPEAKVVTSGVAEVARLQAEEGYVYLRP
jgi:intracellular sulfur oxidation DsrE/DsrF family protein